MQAQPGERRRWVIGAGAVVVLAVVGALVWLSPFGGTLSRAEFIAEADRICARAQEAFAELQAEPPRSAAAASELTAELLEIAEDERDEIAGLARPAELDDAVERYLEARDEGIALIRDGLEAADRGRAEPYRAAQAELARTQRDPRRRLAREVGFRRCSRPLDRGAGGRSANP